MLSEIFDLLNTFFCFASSWIRYAPRMSGRGCRCQSSGGHQRGQNRGLAQDKQRDSVEMRTLFFLPKTKNSRFYNETFRMSQLSQVESSILRAEFSIFALLQHKAYMKARWMMFLLDSDESQHDNGRTPAFPYFSFRSFVKCGRFQCFASLSETFLMIFSASRLKRCAY